MDVLFTIAMLGLMVAAIILLGRTWPRSARGGGYRAGRGLGAGDAAGAPRDGAGRRGAGAHDGTDGGPAVPQEEDAPWRWSGGDGGGAGDDGGPGDGAGAGGGDGD